MYNTDFILLIIIALSICSINVNGIHERPKRIKVFHSLQAANCDIYLLQDSRE